jgi:hypothetical protein
MHQATMVPPIEVEEKVSCWSASKVCVSSFISPRFYFIFDRNRGASRSLSVRGAEALIATPMHPIQELECRVNALDEAIETEVGSAILLGVKR